MLKTIRGRRIVASSLVAVAFGAPSLVLAQETFQAEAGLSYSRLDSDTSRQNSVLAVGTYFFDKLPSLPKDYPLEQAQFVERIGKITADYVRTSSDQNGFQSVGDGSQYGAAVEFRRPDTPLVARAGYQSLKSPKLRSVSTLTEFESDLKFYELAIGAYVEKNTLLALDWSTFRSQSQSKSTGGLVSETKDTSTTIAFGGQHLARLPGDDHLAVTATIAETTLKPEGASSEKNRSISLQTIYYPTKMLGLKLGVSSDRGDDGFSEGETYQAGASMFVTPAVSLSLDFLRFKAKAPNNDFDFVALSALLRF